MPQSEKWFDRETGLLYEEIERDTETSDVVRRVYSDYREVDGVQVPWLIQQITEVEGYPDHVVDLRMQVVHHREVPQDRFALPELGPTEPEPDQLLAALDGEIVVAQGLAVRGMLRHVAREVIAQLVERKAQDA